MSKDNTETNPSATKPADVVLLDRTHLSQMDAKQHYDLAHVLVTIREVMIGLCCQPRFTTDTGVYNGAGEILDKMIEGCDSAIEAVRESAQSSEAIDHHALLYKWMVPIAREVDFADDLYKIAALSIEAANEVSSTKIRAARRFA